MKIVFMGTPNFAVPILEALAKKYEVVLVVSQPDKEVGRKKILTHPPVAAKALELGLDLFQPVKLRDEYKEILDKNADIIVTAAYGQIVPDVILNSVKKAINVHGSLLPKYRGGAPIQRSIMAGDKVTGISIIDMVSKLDAGGIYKQVEVEISDDDNSTSMFNKLSIAGRDLLIDTIDEIYSGRIKSIEQDDSKAIYSPNIKREEEKIDFNKKSFDIFNLIRGLSEEPGAYGVINDEVIKIYSSEIISYDGSENPGQIIDLKKRILVKTLDGAISLVMIKPSGKKMMNAKDFLNGQKLLKIGDIFN